MGQTQTQPQSSKNYPLSYPFDRPESPPYKRYPFWNITTTTTMRTTTEEIHNAEVFEIGDDLPFTRDIMEPDDGLSIAPTWEWTWDKTVKSIVLSPIVIMTILGNFLVIYAFLTRKRDLRSPTHFFIANLSLADFLVGILAMPFLAVLQSTDRWYFGQNFCYAWVIIHFWLCSASILSTLAVCVERYIGVKYALRHMDIMNNTRVMGMIVGVWALAGFLTLLSVLAFPEPRDSSPAPFSCKVNNQLGHVLIATIAILYIPALLMIYLYWNIYLIASIHLKTMKKAYNGGGGVSNNVSSVGGGIEKKHTSRTKTWSKLNFFQFNSTSATQEENSSQLSDFGKHGKSYSGESGISSCGRLSEDSGVQGNVHLHNQPNYTQITEKTSPVSINCNHPSTDKVSDTTIKTISQSASSTNIDRNQKQINLAKRLSLLVGILLLSYLPFFTAFLIRAFDISLVPNTLFTILGWIRYFNSCLNPFIYAYAVPAYRKAFQSIFSGCCKK